jgi:hypothetical protein
VWFAVAARVYDPPSESPKVKGRKSQHTQSQNFAVAHTLVFQAVFSGCEPCVDNVCGSNVCVCSVHIVAKDKSSRELKAD